ncbi:hypothetical protein G9A89_023458 [Geosiphon pyriformis]|nr:hypothetical protein G9A89_023458 [Geosiphon pyriformis]
MKNIPIEIFKKPQRDVYKRQPIFLSFPPYRKELSNIIQLRDELETLMRGLLKRVEDDLEKKPCVSQDFLQKLNEGSIDELSVITLCNVFMLAGTETVAITIYWLIAILANHPEFQQKAHKELDKVVGRKRLPNISDFNSLPYIQSLIKETLRWIPLMMNILGYHIPKNSMIYLNVYALNFDENRYQNPDVFNPDRFLDSKESMAASAKGSYENRDHYSFSMGRRICTRIHLAEAETLSILSGLLWTFKIENVKRDATGRVLPIDLNNSFKSRLQTPYPFNVRFIPRHQEINL